MRPWVSIALYFLFTATITVIRDCATVLEKEIGWRGFLVPELAKRNNFAATAIISGFIGRCGTILFFCLPTATTAAHPSGTTFVHCAAANHQLLVDLDEAQVRQPVAGCRVARAHNTFFQQFFAPLTVENSNTRYVAGEFGAALLVISAVMAIYFWSYATKWCLPHGWSNKAVRFLDEHFPKNSLDACLNRRIFRRSLYLRGCHSRSQNVWTARLALHRARGIFRDVFRIWSVGRAMYRITLRLARDARGNRCHASLRGHDPSAPRAFRVSPRAWFENARRCGGRFRS